MMTSHLVEDLGKPYHFILRSDGIALPFYSLLFSQSASKSSKVWHFPIHIIEMVLLYSFASLPNKKKGKTIKLNFKFLF